MKQSLVAAAVMAALAMPAVGESYSLGDAIPVKGVTHTDPHRGTTLMKDATVTFE